MYSIVKQVNKVFLEKIEKNVLKKHNIISANSFSILNGNCKKSTKVQKKV